VTILVVMGDITHFESDHYYGTMMAVVVGPVRYFLLRRSGYWIVSDSLRLVR